MTTKQEQAKELFLLAIDVSAHERESFLADRCGDDAELRRNVEQLLRGHHDGLSLVDRVVTDETKDDSAHDFAGTPIGPYKLLEVIGEGGMGTVYMADQTQPVRRRVAVKVIKTGMDTRQVIARFEAERQALALMEHPNISKVLDAGSTETGRPYFVMELVKGTPITKFCDAQHLSTVQRLQLFQQVCHAVQHAHQKGIIHRDIKPSNVLVAMYDDKPVAKVIDFGVAKATGEQLTEKTMFTRFGQVVGTLEYMSPEQAQFNQLDIDTRSDIYSLGAILYELLAGEPPFDQERLKSQALDETLRMIREEEPTKPSTKLSSAARLGEIAINRNTTPEKLGSQLRGDLDWIVMKALDKDRSRRYETANGLALDLERFLNDEPVFATPPSMPYRFRKFATRNKAAMGLSVLTSLFLIVGIAGLAASNYRLAESDKATKAALKEADENLQLARENLQSAKTNEARAQLEAGISEAVNDFINSIMGKANPFEEPDRNLTVSELLARALMQLDGKFEDQPLVEAKLRTTIARALGGLGLYDKENHERATILAIYERELGSRHRTTLESELAVIVNAHNRYQYRMAFQQSESLLRKCLSEYGIEDELTLKITLIRANLNRRLGNYTEAEQHLLETLAIQERVFGPSNEETLTTLGFLASCHENRGQYDDAEKLYRRILEATNNQPKFLLRTLSTEYQLVAIIGRQARYAEAETLSRHVLDTRRRVLGNVHPATSASISQLVWLLKDSGLKDQAEKLLRDSILEHERLLGRENTESLVMMVDVAVMLLESGRFEDGEKLCREVLKQRDLESGETHPDVLRARLTLAGALLRQFRIQEAEKLFRQVVNESTTLYGKEHQFTLSCLYSFCELLKIQQTRFNELEDIARELVKIYDQRFGPKHPRTLVAKRFLADAMFGQGHYEEATTSYLAVADIQKIELRPNHPDTLLTLGSLGVAYYKLNQTNKAIQVFEELATGSAQELGENHPETLTTIANLGVNYKNAGDLEKAIYNLRKAHEAALENPRLLFATGQLIDAYVKQGEVDQAEALVPKYLESIRSKLPKNMAARYLASLARDYHLATDRVENAEILLRESIAIFERIMPDDKRTSIVRFRLGLAMAVQKKFDEAEAILAEAADGLMNNLESFSPLSLSLLIHDSQRIAKIYSAADVESPDKGYAEKAAQWQKNAEEFQKREVESDK